MEEKIFSRAATKTFLSDLVIDAKNIDRLFTQREMDLMQVCAQFLATLKHAYHYLSS
jgi:hypothetical protein